jgi:predicted deacetylase
VAILIPAFNEAEQLSELLASCRAVGPELIVVVDDASKDDTALVLERERRRDPRLVVLRNRENLGKQGSVKRGLQELCSRALDAVVLVDGDGQHDPADLPHLLHQLCDHDFVIGARSTAEMPLHRRLSNRLVNLAFRVLGGVDFIDVQSGLRAYRKPLADLLSRELSSDGDYGLEHESLAVLARYAHRHGIELRGAAVPVSCRYGEAPSKMTPGHMLRLVGQTLEQAWQLGRAGRGAPARAMTVEIHDVSPATFDEVRELDAALARLGVDRPCLLVVPRHEGQDLREAPEVAAWLRRRQLAGAEIVQHGLTHRAPGPPPRGLRNAVMHSWFSRGTAEFAHLSREQAARRLLDGKRILEECGLHPAGFIAPAWQQSPAALSTVARLGYRFTAFLGKVLTFGRAELATPALTFAAPNAWVDYVKRLVMRGLEAWARPAPLLRVALHPEDLRGARPADHALERMRRLKRYRRLVTYSEWLDDKREAA